VYEIIQRKNGRSTEKVEEPNGIPQTLPESVRSSCASKKAPQLLSNKPFQYAWKVKLEIAEKSLTWIRQRD
jgi:hypothetical protein